MRHAKKQPVLVGLQEVFPESKFFHLDRADLDLIVDVLNRKPRGQWLYTKPLVRLVERLKECGSNLKQMMDGDPELAKTVAMVCGTRWMPTNRRANLVLQPSWKHIRKTRTDVGAGGPAMRPERYAALLFHVGTLNPEWDKLAGPCPRCDNYYIKKRASQKVYCSRRCGNAATAIERTRQRLDKEHADKLRRAAAAGQKWARERQQGHTRKDWKQRVSEIEPDITPKFLTRAVNKGELKTPTKGG